MEDTFEVIERYTLSHFHDYIDPSLPAKFTKGVHRDVNCSRLAEELRKRKDGNSKLLVWELYLVFLDEQENCIGIKSIRPITEFGFVGLNLRLIFSLCLTSQTSKVIFLMTGQSSDWVKNSETAKDFRNYLKMIECEFVELRYIYANGEVKIQDGNEE